MVYVCSLQGALLRLFLEFMADPARMKTPVRFFTMIFDWMSMKFRVLLWQRFRWIFIRSYWRCVIMTFQWSGLDASVFIGSRWCWRWVLIFHWCCFGSWITELKCWIRIYLAKHILEDLIWMYYTLVNVVYRKIKPSVFVTFCSALF